MKKQRKNNFNLTSCMSFVHNIEQGFQQPFPHNNTSYFSLHSSQFIQYFSVLSLILTTDLYHLRSAKRCSDNSTATVTSLNLHLF